MNIARGELLQYLDVSAVQVPYVLSAEEGERTTALYTFDCVGRVICYDAFPVLGFRC